MATEREIKMAIRLARAIASDLSIYNQSKIEEGLKNDNIFELLKEELDEGRSLYEKKVSKEIAEEMNFFERAMIDTLIATQKSIKTPIF